MIQSIFRLAIPVASFLDRKHERKYKEMILELKEEYDEEEGKSRPDMAKLHNINTRLMRIIELFGSEISRQRTLDK
jgi:uncharacterized membrane protein (DUF106 family)